MLTILSARISLRHIDWLPRAALIQGFWTGYPQGYEQPLSVNWTGVPGKIRTCDLPLHTPSVFTARPSGSVRGLDFIFTVRHTARRCCPSSLYTFPPFHLSMTGGLGSVLPPPKVLRVHRVWADSHRLFPDSGAQLSRRRLLYPAELRGLKRKYSNDIYDRQWITIMLG